MAPDKISREISATEKLLQIIRSEAPDPLPASGAPPPVASSIRRKSARRSPSFPFTGKTKIAVQMSQGKLRLIKVRRRSGQRYELLDSRSLPVPENRRAGSELVELLRSALDDFADPGKQTELWALVQDSMAEIRQIRIPKVGTKQPANEIYRAIMEQVQPDRQATVVDYVVLGEATEQGGAKRVVMVLLVPRRGLDDIQALFAAAGYRVTGISLGPFAVENLLRCGWIQSETASVANLYIGHRHSRIDIFSKDRLQLSRAIRTGIDSMVGSLQDQLRERRAGSILGRQNGDPGDDVTRCRLENGVEAEQARQMVGRLVLPEAEFEAGSGDISLSRDQVFAGIRPAVDRLIRQVERTLQYCAGTFGNEPAKPPYVTNCWKRYPATNRWMPISSPNPISTARMPC